jgi:hypothetical protein
MVGAGGEVSLKIFKLQLADQGQTGGTPPILASKTKSAKKTNLGGFYPLMSYQNRWHYPM